MPVEIRGEGDWNLCGRVQRNPQDGDTRRRVHGGFSGADGSPSLCVINPHSHVRGGAPDPDSIEVGQAFEGPADREDACEDMC